MANPFFDDEGLKNAGHDDVGVPQTVERTVEDWEGGTLDTDVWNLTKLRSEYTVQSSVVDNGNHALELDGIATTIDIISSDGLAAYAQKGDKVTVYYRRESDDTTNTTFEINEVFTQLNPDEDKFTFGGNTVSEKLIGGEWYEFVYKFDENPQNDSTLTVYDSNGNQQVSVDAAVDLSNRNQYFEFEVFNSSSPLAYLGDIHIERREPEARANTQKGTTQLGNEVVPSGSIQTGPTTSSTNAERAVYQDAPVNSNATQGTESILTLLQSGVTPSAFVQRTLDGQGGAYGHQLQAGLGKFARFNTDLTFDYETLSDVPSWNVDVDNSGVVSVELTGNPRKLRINGSGSGGVKNFGGFKCPINVSEASLGAFRLMFHGLDCDFSNVRLYAGLTDAPLSDDVVTGTGIMFEQRESSGGGVSNYFIYNNGSQLDSGDVTNSPTFTNTMSIEYTGSEIRFFSNGVLEAESTVSPSGKMYPFIQLEDISFDNKGGFVETEQVTIEPLPEVLQ